MLQLEMLYKLCGVLLEVLCKLCGVQLVGDAVLIRGRRISIKPQRGHTIDADVY